MPNPIEAATEAFGKTLRELERRSGAPELLDDPSGLGRRAALMVVAERLWGEHLGPLLEVEEVKSLLCVGSRQAVSDLAKRGRLLALDAAGGRKVYPAFQFARGGRPFPELPEILKAFDGAAETPYTIASWLVSPQDLLERQTPAAWMQAGREPDRLFEAARRSAAKLAH